MALPSFLSSTWGFYLARKSVATGEWFFVAWASGDTGVIYDNPGPGVWQYELRASIGSDSAVATDQVGYGTGTFVTRCDLVVQNLKR